MAFGEGRRPGPDVTSSETPQANDGEAGSAAQAEVGDRAGRGSRILGNRAVLISTASTLVFIAAIAVVVALAPGFDSVRRSFFDLDAMREAFFGTQTTPSVWRAFLLG